MKIVNLCHYKRKAVTETLGLRDVGFVFQIDL